MKTRQHNGGMQPLPAIAPVGWQLQGARAELSWQPGSVVAPPVCHSPAPQHADMLELRESGRKSGRFAVFRGWLPQRLDRKGRFELSIAVRSAAGALKSM